MQPLFADQPVLLSVLLVSLLIWRVMEASVDIRTFKRLRAGARRQDKGSHAVLKAQLGQRYQEYMRRTKPLIPFVL